jgi:hypothetical protein
VESPARLEPFLGAATASTTTPRDINCAFYLPRSWICVKDNETHSTMGEAMGTHSVQDWCCLLFKSIGFFVHCFGLVFRVNICVLPKIKIVQCAPKSASQCPESPVQPLSQSI